MSDPARHPLDGSPSVPPPGKETVDYVTRDLLAELERAVLRRVERIALARGITQRAAVAFVVEDLDRPVPEYRR